MKTPQPALHFTLLIACLSLALPLSTRADAYISATAGSGPNGYHSAEVNGNADLFDTPLNLNMFGFKSSTSASDEVTQQGIGLDWDISELATLGIKHSRMLNGSVDINTNALSLALSLDTLWDSDLLTLLELKQAGSAYQFNDLPAAVKNDTIQQTASSIGLTQDIVSSLSIYAWHDSYSYDRDPVNAAAVLIITAPRKFANTSFTLLGFPDTTNRLGFTWRALEQLTLDVSTSKTDTKLDQEIITRRVSIDYQASDNLDISAAVSRSTSTEVVTKKAYILVPVGTTVMSPTDDTYTELTLGWTFF